jgi:CHC2 zinc finger
MIGLRWSALSPNFVAEEIAMSLYDIKDLLENLTKVRQIGADRWIACCPAHDDISPSLSVRLTDDGVILMHCFAGCSAADVMNAAGIDPADLFPPRPEEHFKPSSERPRLSIKQLRDIVEHDVLRVSVAAENMAGGAHLSKGDISLLREISVRLLSAMRAL